MALDFSDPQFLISFILTLGIIVAKFIFAGYLLTNANKRTKERGKIQFDFLFSVIVFIICLGVSRILYFIFDFLLTHYDPNLFWVAPNIYFWQIGSFIAIGGIGVVILTIDKQVLHFKMKGIIPVLIFIFATLTLVWPVNSPESFAIASFFNLIGGLMGLVMPITFLYLGMKSSGEVRRNSFLMALGVIIYSVASVLMGENILSGIEAMAGIGGRIFIIFLVPILKVIGLLIFSKIVIKIQYNL